ncbi:MAG: AAA family ATPase [Pseudomonadota bacterium]
MKISHLSVRDVGRFAGVQSWGAFQSGLNVLAAPNEAGKSTVFAALRAVLTEAPGSNRAAAKVLVPLRGGKPEVTLRFEHRGLTYELSKAFAGPKHARFARVSDGLGPEDNVIAQDRDVDAALAEVLAQGVAPATLADGIAAVLAQLWHPQGSELKAPELLGTTGRRLVSTLAEAGASQIASSGTVRAVHGRVCAELLALQTDKRAQPKGDWLAAKEAVADAEARRHDAEQQRETAAQLLEEVARATAARDEARRALAQTQALSAGEALESERAAAERYGDKLRAARNAVTLAQTRLSAAAAEHATFERVLSQEAALCAQVAALASSAPAEITPRDGGFAETGSLSDAATALEALTASSGIVVHELSEALAANERAGNAARSQADEAARVAALAVALTDVERAMGIVATGRDLEAEREAAHAALTKLPYSAAELSALIKTAGQLDAAADAIADGAASVTVEREAGAANRLRIDGAILDKAETVTALTAPMVITIEGIGRITITPPVDVAERGHELKARISAHEAQLRRLGFADVSEVEAAQADFERAQQAASKVDAEYKALAASLA